MEYVADAVCAWQIMYDYAYEMWDWRQRCRTHRTGTGEEHHNHNDHSVRYVVDVVCVVDEIVFDGQ